MKKLLLLLMSLAMTMTCLVHCTSNDEDDVVVLPDVELEDGVASLEVSTPTMISSEADAFTMVMITTNLDLTTIAATVDSDSQDWCSVEVIEDVLVITALTDNTGAEGERSATITVTGGSGDDFLSETFTVTQSTSYVGPVLLINPDAMQLTYGIGSSIEVQAYANRDLSTLVAECDNDHFDVEINYNNGKITVTALETNRSTDDEITATITVTVGEDGDTATSEFTVAQDCIIWTTLTLDVDSIYYNKTVGESYVVNVIANQDNSTIVATIEEEYADCFSVTRSGSALTITSILPNTEVERIVTALNITVGPFYNDLSTSVEIVQGGLPDVVLEADADEVSLSHLVGDSQTFNLTTTELLETIVATTDNDAFAVSVVDAAVTVSIAEVNNSISDEVYGNVTILAGEAPYIDTLVLPLTQATRPASTLTISPDSLLEIAYTEGSTGTITITTNQDEENIWAVAEADNDYFDVVLEGKVVTVTANTTNMSPDDTIDGYVIITVGELEDFIKCDTIYIAQDVSPVATVSLSVSELWVDYEIGSTATFTVTTNKDVESIRVETTDPDLFAVSVDGTTVTVMAATSNTTTDAIWSASVFVYVGWEDDDPVFQTNTSIPVYLRPNAYVPVIGDYYTDENGSLGVVWWVDSDYRSFKMVAIEDGGDYRVVYTTITSFYVDGCTDYYDGTGNTDRIEAYVEENYGDCATYAPIIAWVREKGPEWYLPARAEYNTLLSLYYSNSTYAASLTAYSCGIRSEFYWSSTINSAGTANAIKYTSSSSASRSDYGSTNTSGRYARRVRLVTVY